MRSILALLAIFVLPACDFLPDGNRTHHAAQAPSDTTCGHIMKITESGERVRVQICKPL